MHSISYSPIGNAEFTKDLLDQNFAAIGEYTVMTADYLASVNEQTVMLRAEVQELAKQVAKASSNQKGNVLPFVIGAAAGIYLYSQFRVRWKVGSKAGEFGKGPKKDETIKTDSTRV